MIVSIEIYALDQDFYAKEYAKLATAKTIGMSERDLTQVTQKLLSYTCGHAENLDMEAEINGLTREVFGAREKNHMEDVRNLYLSARNVRTCGLVCAAAFFVVVFILKPKKALNLLCLMFLRVSAAFVAIIAGIGLWAAIDFPSFWTAFHNIFFTNDLWLLNPQTDVLIMMVPQQFFSDLVRSILILFAAAFVVLNVAAAFLARCSNRQTKGV